MFEQPDLYNADCMDGMKEFPDNFFDLAIVDPPYGGANSDAEGGGTARHYTFGLRKKDKGYEDRRNMGREICKKINAWDIAPKEEYFKELFRVSRNQIIWGGNYFDLPPTRCFLIWRKLSISENFSMAMAEYAWTSFNSNAKVFEFAPQGKKEDQRFHPTQKPIELYQWCLSNYAKKGDKILDTHVGSASSLIACHNAGLEAWGFEIDGQYYEKAKQRLQRAKEQVTMFELI